MAVIACDNCKRELLPEDAVVVWHAEKRVGFGSGFVRVRGCKHCVDAAINEEIGVRGFSLKRAMRLLRGEPMHAREAEWNHCGRSMFFVTETKYGGPYGRTAYCSDYCRDEHGRTPRGPKICKVCAVGFEPTRSDAKTCSPACKQKAYRQRLQAL